MIKTPNPLSGPSSGPASGQARSAWARPAPRATSAYAGSEDRDVTSADGTSDEKLVGGSERLTRVSDPPERQATDIRAMHFVLGGGLAGAIIGMLVAYLIFDFGWY